MITELSFSTLPIETIAQLGFYIVTGIFAVFSGILYYHWQAYATDANVYRLTLISYFALTVPLLIIMGIMTFII